MPSAADLARIRAFIARELDTINEYAAMAEAAEDPVVKELFVHVTREEKEHVAEGMKLLNALDADQAAHAGAHADVLLGRPAPSAAAAAVPPPATAAPVAGTFTVGSLRRSG